MYIDVHVIVIDQHDFLAFSAKQTFYDHLIIEMKKRNISNILESPALFQYSVPYVPHPSPGDTVFIVNSAENPIKGFDNLKEAKAFAISLYGAGQTQNISINTVLIIKGGESEFERKMISKALEKRYAKSE